MQCFMHHGVGYAQDVWQTVGAEAKLQVALNGVDLFSRALNEPFFDRAHGRIETLLWARFYHRLRFGGFQVADAPQSNQFIERIAVLDLEQCMR